MSALSPAQDGQTGVATPLLAFGDPERPRGHLRDLLERWIDGVPHGGEIAIAVYYFRDTALARALVRAHERGVRVCVLLADRPRRRDANERVAAQLAASGVPVTRVRWLHLKVFCFSHPTPTVFLGTFNPSGDGPDDDPAVLAEIGDQDRGTNTLIGFTDPTLIATCRARVAWLERAQQPQGIRLHPWANRPVRAGAHTLYGFPRLRPGVMGRAFKRVGRGDRVRIAASHITDRGSLRAISAMARRGADVRIVTHDTERRMPAAKVAALRAAGVAVARYRHPAALPMHDKMTLIETSRERCVYVGSFNFTDKAVWRNHELLLRSTDASLLDALAARWAALAASRYVTWDPSGGSG